METVILASIGVGVGIGIESDLVKFDTDPDTDPDPENNMLKLPKRLKKMNSEGLTLSGADSIIGRNAPRRFYLEAHCIGCMVCVEIAPQIFIRQGEEEIVVVGRQPVGEQEIARCQEAAEICPVEAIGEQGEKVLRRRRIGSELKCSK